MSQTDAYDPSKTVRGGSPGAPASHRPLPLAGENGPRRAGKETLKSVFLVSRIIPNTTISRSIRGHVAAHGIPLPTGTIDRAPVLVMNTSVAKPNPTPDHSPRAVR